MPFDQWETVKQRTTRDVRASVSYRGRKREGGRSTPTLVIGIPRSACEAFKLKPSDTFVLLVGNGADKGKARITRAPGGTKPRVVRGAAVFTFGHVPKLGNDAAAKEYVAVNAMKDGCEITLPPWFVEET